MKNIQYRGKQFMKIKLFVLAVFVLLTCLSVAPAQTKKVAEGIRAVDFRNRSYSFGEGDDEQTVKIRNGKAKLNNGGEIYEVRKNDVVYGDVNGDGAEDAVVRIRLTTGASLRGFEIQAYKFRNGKAEMMARLDMPQVQEDYTKEVCCTGEGLKIKNGHVIFEALTDGEIFLSYEKITTFDYNLSGTELVMNVKPQSRKKP